MKRSNMFVLSAALICASIATATIAFADDFWLVANAFRVEVGDDVVLRGQTSSRFPTSRTAVAVDRVADARLISEGSDVALAGLSIQGRSLVIRGRPSRAGQYAVAVSLHPRSVRESADGFRRYLDAEGAAAARERVEREGLLNGKDSVTRRYAKYAKTLVQVGTGGARAFARPAGHVIEFVPLSDPTALRAGDTLEVRLLFRGEPLAGIPVHAEVVALDADRDAPSASTHADPGGAAAPSTFTPDARGIVRVPLGRGGMWSIRTIHVTQARAGSGADWDTHWGTLVFALDEPSARQRE